MKLFYDGLEYYIARDRDHLEAIVYNITGEPIDRDDWLETADDKPITIWCDADGDPCDAEEDGASEISRTAAEWAMRGEGLLCVAWAGL